jgi:hypothetical protein
VRTTVQVQAEMNGIRQGYIGNIQGDGYMSERAAAVPVVDPASPESCGIAAQGAIREIGDRRTGRIINRAAF